MFEVCKVFFFMARFFSPTPRAFLSRCVCLDKQIAPSLAISFVSHLHPLLRNGYECTLHHYPDRQSDPALLGIQWTGILPGIGTDR